MTKLVEELIPHRRTMKLIDSINNYDKDSFSSTVNITKDSLLYTNEGVPTHTALEYMAQTVAAFNAYHYTADQNSKIGFIISIRNLKRTRPYFKLDELLIIKVMPTAIMNNIGNFECEIQIDNIIVSNATITAYVPTNEELLRFKND